MNVEKFVVIKPIEYDGKTVDTGNELSIVHGCVYFNGGLLPPSMQKDWMEFIANEKKIGFKYIRPDNPIYNKL